MPRALIVLFGLSSSVLLGYCPRNGDWKCGKGVAGITHQDITEVAYEQIVAEPGFLATPITTLTKSMKKARDQMVDANANIDDDQKTASKHFDGESFPQGAQRLLDRLADVVTAIHTNKDAQAARLSLGQSFHTLQDFYSHSNWVESLNTIPHPSLGRSATFAFAGPLVPTCQDCTGIIGCPNCDNNLISTLLTSGYYGGETAPFDKKPAGKCSHGGPFDSSAKGLLGEGINKDTLFCDFSPHTGFHLTSALVARDATKDFFRLVASKITPAELKLLMGVGPTLGMVIDTTGSMGDIISQVQAQAIAIVDGRLGTDEEPGQYVLSPFNDPTTGPVTVTNDAVVFKNAINALGASGGGDCPELSQTGIFNGLAASDEGGDLFMFTDASAKDAAQAGAVASLAEAKKIQVYPFVFGSCSPIDPSYYKVANASGGQVFVLARTEAGTITKLADLVIRANAVTLLSVADTISGSQSYTVPVDSTMTKFTVSVSGLTSVTVTRPNGSVVNSGDPGATITLLSSGKIISVTSPPVGNWTILLSGSGDVTVTASGESTLDFTSFRFVAVGGRPGHQGLFPIDGLPAANQPGTVAATVEGPFGSALFNLRSKTGTPLQALNLTPDERVLNQFFGPVTPPATPFLPYVSGLDVNGKAYQRVITSLITPEAVIVTGPPSQDLRPNQLTTFVFQVQNLGASADTFNFTATDNKGYIQGTSPASAVINPGQIVQVTVQVKPPTGTATGTSDVLSFNAQSTNPSGAANSATLSLSVTTVGLPQVAAKVSATGLQSPGTLFFDVQFTSTGTANAANVLITSLSARTLTGGGSTTPNTTLTPLPFSVGRINVGQTVTVRLYANTTGTVSRLSFTETGIIQDEAGSGYEFSSSQAIIP